MNQSLPKIIPVNELKNTSNIMKQCQESEVPIVITRNGYGEAVLMSIKLYEELFSKVQVATLLNDSLDQVENGIKGVEGKEFFSSMKEKYGK